MVQVWYFIFFKLGSCVHKEEYRTFFFEMNGSAPGTTCKTSVPLHVSV